MDRSQIINYLKITKCPLGILINFGENSLMYERYI
ncbi:GxxExxY protein [uncultured Prevotella sp.]|nr:GxxExxY protein [uncultured Prevotella sp.]